MLKLDRLSYFQAVADTGSFTQAADRLGVTKAVVSAQVARLEEELGVSLFVRTTRSVTLTEDGELLLGHTRQIQLEADSAEEALNSKRAAPTGVLRIAAPLDYGQTFLVPVLTKFRSIYPACTVELDLRDSMVDLQSGNWDLSIRLGWLSESSLKSRRVGSFMLHLVASPELAARFDDPVLPDDLAPWPFVANAVLRDPTRHEFTNHEGQRVRLRSNVVAGMTTTPAVLAGALSGLGAAILPDFLVAEPVAAGRLVQLLPDWRLPEGGIHIVYPPARFRPPRVVEFTKLLVDAEKHRRMG
ncbi:LysR family transcriptional regulator [Rhodobium gokarnense]|uniref:DNA-binding transcriptional LysR family regulator n=1 Tax=Rhodobium gokarnense TaxID=364296 RepID=A0ABT3HD24_9HYPH|nr:LysR family transcriptional regulator [Rhodobium gokarnense]MCW2308275.1 DNA-binding transcriptional LysR family regulator [Rhodobium gokarnense]